MNIKKSILFLCVGIFLILLFLCREGGYVVKLYNVGINIIFMFCFLEKCEGSFKLFDGVFIGVIIFEVKKIVMYFVVKISLVIGYDVKVEDKGEIILVLDFCVMFFLEGYVLDVELFCVQVIVCFFWGLFYGMQSFLQLFLVEIESVGIVWDVDWEVFVVNIIDLLCFVYCGIYMDFCCYFMMVEEVKKQIDVLFMFKINMIYWYLMDDQGWCIEIK